MQNSTPATTTHATSHWTVRDCALCGTRLDLTHKADRDHACALMKQYGEHEPAAPRTITVTYQVVLEVKDGEPSLNDAIDAVSAALWSIGFDDAELLPLTASLIAAKENTQADHDNGTCGCCDTATAETHENETCARCLHITDDEVVRSYGQ